MAYGPDPEDTNPSLLSAYARRSDPFQDRYGNPVTPRVPGLAPAPALRPTSLPGPSASSAFGQPRPELPGAISPASMNPAGAAVAQVPGFEYEMGQGAPGDTDETDPQADYFSQLYADQDVQAQQRRQEYQSLLRERNAPPQSGGLIGSLLQGIVGFGPALQGQPNPMLVQQEYDREGRFQRGVKGLEWQDRRADAQLKRKLELGRLQVQVEKNRISRDQTAIDMAWNLIDSSKDPQSRLLAFNSMKTVAKGQGLQLPPGLLEGLQTSGGSWEAKDLLDVTAAAYFKVPVEDVIRQHPEIPEGVVRGVYTQPLNDATRKFLKLPSKAKEDSDNAGYLQKTQSYLSAEQRKVQKGEQQQAISSQQLTQKIAEGQARLEGLLEKNTAKSRREAAALQKDLDKWKTQQAGLETSTDLKVDKARESLAALIDFNKEKVQQLRARGTAQGALAAEKLEFQIQKDEEQLAGLSGKSTAARTRESESLRASIEKNTEKARQLRAKGTAQGNLDAEELESTIATDREKLSGLQGKNVDARARAAEGLGSITNRHAESLRADIAANEEALQAEKSKHTAAGDAAAKLLDGKLAQQRETLKQLQEPVAPDTTAATSPADRLNVKDFPWLKNPEYAIPLERKAIQMFGKHFIDTSTEEQGKVYAAVDSDQKNDVASQSPDARAAQAGQPARTRYKYAPADGAIFDRQTGQPLSQVTEDAFAKDPSRYVILGKNGKVMYGLMDRGEKAVTRALQLAPQVLATVPTQTWVNYLKEGLARAAGAHPAVNDFLTQIANATFEEGRVVGGTAALRQKLLEIIMKETAPRLSNSTLQSAQTLLDVMYVNMENAKRDLVNEPTLPNDQRIGPGIWEMTDAKTGKRVNVKVLSGHDTFEEQYNGKPRYSMPVRK